MSNTFAIVVDASVARGAGDLNATQEEGIANRDFLQELYKCGHRLVWTEDIQAEWEKHQSNFAATWFLMMFKRRKVFTPDTVDDLSETVQTVIHHEPIWEIVAKDLHLVEAALASDLRIASCDDAVRLHLSEASPKLPQLQKLIWVNPTVAKEKAVDWLKAGAKETPSRLLKNYCKPGKRKQSKRRKSE